MLTLRRADHAGAIRQFRMDANETVFLARQLEFIEQRIYKKIYVENSAFRLFPMSSMGGPAATSLIYRTMDRAGKAKIIASYADDLPRVTVTMGEVPSPIRSLGASYGWSLQDVRACMAAGIDLPAEDSDVAVQAHNDETNRIAWFGDSAYALPGLATISGLNTAAALTGGWSTATSEQIIADINEALLSIINTTNGVESADTVVVPPTEYTILATKRASSTAPSDTTILTFLRATWPDVNFTSAVELSGTVAAENGADWGSGDDAMLAYRRDESKLTMAITQPYEEMPVERHALRFEVATHSRVGGLLVRYPKSVAIRTGISTSS